MPLTRDITFTYGNNSALRAKVSAPPADAPCITDLTRNLVEMFNMWAENRYLLPPVVAAASARVRGSGAARGAGSEGPDPQMAPALERASFMTL